MGISSATLTLSEGLIPKLVCDGEGGGRKGRGKGGLSNQSRGSPSGRLYSPGKSDEGRIAPKKDCIRITFGQGY